MNPFDGLPGESFRPGRYAFLGHLLADRGHNVTWWSSNFCHGTKDFRGNGGERIRASENLEIILVKTPRYSHNLSLRRIWNHYTYARGFLAQATTYPQAPDVIIASVPPLLAARAALSWAQKRGARAIVDIQDIWPEAFDVAFAPRFRPVARMLLWPIRRLADRIYDRADGITAVSQKFLIRGVSVSRCKQKGIVVPLCVDIRLYDQCLDRQDVDVTYAKHAAAEFWAIYIGTIGKSYDIKTILQAASKMGADLPDIKFLVVGDGPQLAEMQRFAQREGLLNVTFIGMMSYVHLTHLMRHCDAGLNAIAFGSGISMPNKCFDYMAAGLPLVNSIEGELQQMIAEENIGLQYKAGDAESLMNAVVQLYRNPPERLAMGARARRLAQEKFDMNATYATFERLVTTLGRSGDSPK